MPIIEVSEQTMRSLELAARMSGLTPGQVVARLIDAPSAVDGQLDTSVSPGAAGAAIAIHADYEGVRTGAQFWPGVARVEIVDGPLAGRAFKSPSSAAIAVVSHYKPTVHPNRNGWSFWFVTATGRTLQSVRAAK